MAATTNPGKEHPCKIGADGSPCNNFKVGEAYDTTQCRLCWLYTHDGAYRLMWGGDDQVIPAPRHVVRPPPLAPDVGPGTELRKLLEQLGIRKEVGCKCAAKEVEMNRLGVAGCRERRDELAAWLRDNAKERGWWQKAKAAVKAAATGIAFQLDMTDLYGSLVDLAIQRAQESHS